MTDTKPKNLVKFMNRFDEKEKAFLCNILISIAGRENMHKGLLPFVDINLMVMTLKMVHNQSGLPTIGNYAKKMLAKIPEAYEQDRGNATFFMTLDPVKVYRHFGNHPERGKPLNFLPKLKVTVGKKWSLPKKAYVDDKDVLVAPCVTLMRRCDAENVWDVVVTAKCRYAVENWLLETCS